MRLSSIVLIVVGAAVLVIGIGMSAVGGAGEFGWYQCVASSSGPCITAGNINNQYYTVFLANNDLLNVGLSMLLVGVLILLAGIVTLYMPTVGYTSGIGAGPRNLPPSPMQSISNPVAKCAKCGAIVAPGHRFCAVCGNSLG